MIIEEIFIDVKKFEIADALMSLQLFHFPYSLNYNGNSIPTLTLCIFLKILIRIYEEISSKNK